MFLALIAKKGFYISKTDTNKKIGPRVLEKGQIWQFCDYVFEAIMLKLKYLLYLKNIHSPLDICLASITTMPLTLSVPNK